jgi:hypothetical protein
MPPPADARTMCDALTAPAERWEPQSRSSEVCTVWDRCRSGQVLGEEGRLRGEMLHTRQSWRDGSK